MADTDYFHAFIRAFRKLPPHQRDGLFPPFTPDRAETFGNGAAVGRGICGKSRAAVNADIRGNAVCRRDGVYAIRSIGVRRVYGETQQAAIPRRCVPASQSDRRRVVAVVSNVRINDQIPHKIPVAI